MAIIMEKICDNGFSAEYWKLGMFSIDRNLRNASFTFNLYYNEEHSHETNNFLETYHCSSLMEQNNGELFELYFENKDNLDWKKSCYKYAMEHEIFFKDGISDVAVILPEVSEE